MSMNYKELITTVGVMSLIPPVDRNYILTEVQKLKPNARLLEIGTFVAGTTSLIAKERPDIDIYSIDINTWDPSTDIILHLKERYQLETINDDIVLNIQKAFVSDCPNVTLLTGESLSLDIANLDFVYIDGDHGYEIVLRELHYYWDRSNDGAIIMGDDVNTIEVYDALRMFCLEKNIEYSIYNKTFKIKKYNNTIPYADYTANIIKQFGPVGRERLCAFSSVD